MLVIVASVLLIHLLHYFLYTVLIDYFPHGSVVSDGYPRERVFALLARVLQQHLPVIRLV